MKFRKKLLVMALTAVMALPFNTFAFYADEEDADLAITAKYATEYAVELEFNKAVASLDGVTPVITPDGGDAEAGVAALENSGTRMRITLPEGAKFELDKAYNIDLLGLKDGNSLVSFSADLTLKKLFSDDFESYNDTSELLAKWNKFQFGGSSENSSGTYVGLQIQEDGNKRLVFKTLRNDYVLTNADVEADASQYDSYVVSFDVENGRTGGVQTYFNQPSKTFSEPGAVRFGMHQSLGEVTQVFYKSNDAYWANSELSGLGDKLTNITEFMERTDKDSDIMRFYYDGVFKFQPPESYSPSAGRTLYYKYAGTYGTFGFNGSSWQNEKESGYTYIDNIKAFKPVWENLIMETNDIAVTNLKITGMPEDDTWGEGINLNCGYDCAAKERVITNYIWYGADDHTLTYPGGWTKLSEGVDTDSYVMTADDSDRYIRCRIEQYIGKGGLKIPLQTLDTQPVYKLSAPIAEDVKFAYDTDTMKLTLTYTYVDYNNDEENGTAFKWEQSSDKSAWTDMTETSGTLQLTESDTEKFLRCTVTVKNDAQMGDKAEPVSAVYTLPFKPTAAVSVSGSGSAGSRLTATYEYYDENGDAESGSAASWYRIKNGTKESVGTGFSYIVKSADAGCKIVFGYTPKNKVFPMTGDEVFSSEISIAKEKSSSSSSSSSSGGSTYTMPKTESKPAEITNTEKTEKATFSDIKGHWAEKEITALKDAGLINGKEDGYCPEDEVTRAEWITMLLRAVGTNTGGNTQSDFADVDTSDWFFGAVETAYKEGYISGDGENFRPNDKITREEMAKIIISVYEKKLGETEKASLDSFSDKSEISAWASKFIEKAVNLKLMSGVDSEHFMPLKSATRAEAGVIIYRFYTMLASR